MVNINTALPTVIATPFHPPTEALQHDNLIKPIIPRTEVITSYTKLREDEHRAQFSDQTRTIIQDENERSSDSNEQSQQQSKAEQQRLNFFARRVMLEGDSEVKELVKSNDFKLAISVIQAKYNRAVTPIPEPTIDYQL